MRPLGLALVALVACTSAPAFVCKSNVECVSEVGDPGICETNGSCTFADSSCPTTGRRYPDGATGSLASQCLPPTTGCVKQIAVGTSHSCALRSDGTVWCWGLNDVGEVSSNSGDQLKPTEVLRLPSGHLVTQIGAAEVHTCALVDDGTVWCWGGNDSLQLGQCGAAADVASSAIPLEVIQYQPNVSMPSMPTCNAATPFHGKTLTAGGEHSCAIGADGNLYCWGENQVGAYGGQSGQDPAVFDDVPGPLLVDFDGPVDVQAGDEYTCVEKDEHTVWCFGANTLGELALPPSTNQSFAPSNVTGFSDAKGLVMDDETACVQTNDGGVWCWGNGTTGIFGPIAGTDLTKNFFTATRLTSAGTVYGGGTAETMCLSQNDGDLECLGANDSYQAGVDGGAANITMPTTVPIITVTQASLGADHSCAVTTDGAIWCWGDDTHGQLGDGGANMAAPTGVPQRVDWSCP